jgi:hypothetical protein
MEVGPTPGRGEAGVLARYDAATESEPPAPSRSEEAGTSHSTASDAADAAIPAPPVDAGIAEERDTTIVDASSPPDLGLPIEAGPLPAEPADAGTKEASFDATASPPDAGTATRADAGPSKLVFVTSAAYSGALGGLDGADAICGDHALTAGLPGNFKAWLSTLDVSAPSRLERSTGPYVRTDGAVVVKSFDDLLDGTLLLPIDRTELGGLAIGDVWTGTRSDGTSHPGDDCLGFSTTTSHVAMCGNAQASDFGWTENSIPSCTTRLRLYCFEQ